MHSTLASRPTRIRYGVIAVSTKYSWAHMFYTCAGLFAISTICSFFIDAGTPVFREDRQQGENND